MAGCGLDVAGEPRNLSADATASDFGLALSEVFADDQVHSVVVIYTPPVQSNGAEVAQVLAAAAAGSDKPVVSTFLASRSVPEELQVPDEDGGAARGSIPSSPQPAVRRRRAGEGHPVRRVAAPRRTAGSRICRRSTPAGAEDFVAEFLQRHPPARTSTTPIGSGC